MALRHLQKWHGAGNDFLIDVIEQGTAPWWTPQRAAAICDRHTGLGADGLLVATVGSEIRMQLFNADGSLAEMSGNGIRCLVAAVRKVTRGSWSSVPIVTDAGVRQVDIEMHGDSGVASVSMGVVRGEPTLDGTLGVANVGNPHVVVTDDTSWSDAHREELAAKWANQLGGANVEFIAVAGENHLTLRVIERGVGWTQACGTGSCASAYVARRAGLVGSEVRVDNPGGSLIVTFDGDEATLRGPVQFVGHVEWLEA